MALLTDLISPATLTGFTRAAFELEGPTISGEGDNRLTGWLASRLDQIEAVLRECERASAIGPNVSVAIMVAASPPRPP